MPTLHIQLEERDYVNAARTVATPSARTIVLLLVASALVCAAVFVGWRAGYERQAFIAAFIWVFGWAGAGIGQMISIPPKARRLFRQQQELRRPHDLIWNERGVTIVGENGQATTPWADFHKCREREDQFILFLSEATFFMIPKRAFPDDVLIRDFRGAVSGGIQRK